MKTKFILLTVILSYYSLAFSQSDFGLSGGLNLSNCVVNDKDPYETKALPGAMLGLAIKSQLNKNLYIRTEILFSQKGVKLNENQDDFKYIGYERINYFAIPVIGELKPGGEKSPISIFAGPYIGIGIGGKYDIEETINNNTENYDGKVEFAQEINSSNINSFEDGSTVVKRFDLGIDFGIGINIKRLSFNFIYEIGAANIEPKNTFYSSESKRFNRNARISFTYYFEKKANN